MEHLAPVELYVFDTTLNIHIPFEGVFSKCESVEVRGFEDLSDTGLDATGSRGVKSNNFSHQVFVLFILRQREWLVTE